MNQYDIFYELHHREYPFLLANAWNVTSAQILENAGFEAIGTSSGAIAHSLGYEDGEKIPFEILLYIVKRIKANISVPLTVDLERGYSDDLNILEQTIQKLLDIGISGINIEDAQGEEQFTSKLVCIKEYLYKTNQHLFINARTDVFLQKLPSPLETTIARAGRYHEAGADGLFVPAVSDPVIIKSITSSTTLPVNIVGSAQLSSVETIDSCNVKRISMAVFLYKATYHQLEAISQTIKMQNSLAPLYASK
jgi:2-methylisocitrate lyase-like PEP mutase family enzyme